MDIDLDQVPDFGSMPLKERLRFWAGLGAKAARARGKTAMWQAEMEAGAMEAGVMLLDVQGDTVEWKGRQLEPVLAERLEFEDDEFLDDDDQDQDDDHNERGPWPVNVEKDLLERLRAANFDLDDLLATHAETMHERTDQVLATVGRLKDEFLAVLTVSDILSEFEATFVFSLNRYS